MQNHKISHNTKAPKITCRGQSKAHKENLKAGITSCGMQAAQRDEKSSWNIISHNFMKYMAWIFFSYLMNTLLECVTYRSKERYDGR